ncbi:ASCH domain-containing protein [Paludibacter sp. 221]|nr:ASCH domain-containing protein [Paludibacter sp. 221]
MVLSGDKKEEYREIKPYWMKRLTFCFMGGFVACKYNSCGGRHEHCMNAMNDVYTHVEFRNGYSSKSPKILLELKGIIVGKGHKEWGAPDDNVFIIRLGEIIETKNITPN